MFIPRCTVVQRFALGTVLCLLLGGTLFAAKGGNGGGPGGGGGDPDWVVTDLGHQADANDISDVGMFDGDLAALVVGRYDFENTLPLRAAVWKVSPSGEILDVYGLGTLGGETSEARAVNNLGHVVGTSETLETFLPPGSTYPPVAISHAFLIIPDFGLANPWWADANQDGVNDLMIDLNVNDHNPPDVLTNSYAWSINSSGQILGEVIRWDDSAQDWDSNFNHWFFDGQQVSSASLSPFGGRNINDSSFVTSGGVVTSVNSNGAVTDAYALGAGGLAIANNGMVVGSISFDGETHAFLVDPDFTSAEPWFVDDDNDGLNDLIQDLGHLGTGFAVANDVRMVNGEPYVVGDSAAGNTDTAFVWENGTMKALDSLDSKRSKWNMRLATACNDTGQIVGYGFFNRQAGHAYLLTPPAPSP